jgi:hypothetical protein
MVRLGGFVGAVVALILVFVFTEWLFVDAFSSGAGDALEVVIVTVAVALGWLIGSRAVRRLAGGRASPRSGVSEEQAD